VTATGCAAISSARRARKAAGATAADSSRGVAGFSALSGDCQYDHARVEAKRSQP
jgi:hypothetical protein